MNNYTNLLLTAEYKPKLLKSRIYTLKLLKKNFNLTEKEINLITSGGNGCYMFYVDNDNNLNKCKLCNIGLTYIDEREFIRLIEQLPIKNKKEKENEETSIFIQENN